MCVCVLWLSAQSLIHQTAGIVVLAPSQGIKIKYSPVNKNPRMLPGFQTSDLHNAINLGSQGKCRQGSHEWVIGGVKKIV